MPHYSRTRTVQAPPSAVFAVVDDVTRTPEWLARCTRVDNLSGGPTAVGTKLRYHYRDGRRTGVMAGSVVAREVDRRLSHRFTDKLTEVTVEFDLAPSADGGTVVTHTVDVQTKGLGKLLTPLISRRLPAQTDAAVAALARLVESPA